MLEQGSAPQSVQGRESEAAAQAGDGRVELETGHKNKRRKKKRGFQGY